jgi:hypothetical protein
MLKITIKSGRLIIIGGASQSGKTTYTSQQIKNDKRIIAWDPEDQYSQMQGFIRVTKPSELIRLTQSSANLRIAYVCNARLKANFELWAAAAYRWAVKFGGCTAIAEELADVSTPSKAPEKFGLMIRRGLKRGMNIYCISQRWAEADKTSIGNASEFVCFRMNGDDIPYMARKTRIPIETLEGLNSLEYVRYVPATKQTIKAKVKFN